MLRGKTAVITGCLQGIGRSVLDVFAANGADVYACAQYEAEEFTSHITDLQKEFGVEIIPVYFDMMSNDEIKASASRIQKHKKNIDILVNIAGMNKDALFPMVTSEDMQTTFQVNFFSQIYLSQYIARMMLRTGNGGSIIFTSSVSGLDGNAGQLSYASSKAALVAATKTMAAELGPKGIRVNAIAPGVIDTAMYNGVPEDIVKDKLINSDLGRAGKPEEVSNLVLFLASDMSCHITGQIIRVDGGIGG